MSGDCSALELDMSASDRQTVIEEVSIVYHCAATIRFDETLKKAVLLNTRGTKCMLDLAEQMKNLAVSVPMLMWFILNTWMDYVKEKLRGRNVKLCALYL